MIAVINMEMGNLASVANALEYLAIKFEVEKDPEKFSDYDKFILPGVGAFPTAMQHLESSGAKDAIIEEVKVKQKPLFGICLGMQLLFDYSMEHGRHEGLGLVEVECWILKIR